jgi:hypothetical protein
VPVAIGEWVGALCDVRLGPIALRLPHRGVPARAAALAIRQGALLLGGDGAADSLRCRVAKAAYLGSYMEFGVTVDGLVKELFVIAPDVTAPQQVGREVSIRLAPHGLAVVPLVPNV